MYFKDHEYESYDQHRKDDYKRGCGYHKKEDHKKSRHYENCVADVLEAILAAQKKADKDNGCHTSCKQSIEDLLGEEKKVKKNTIPFILYCGCDPYKGTGVTTYHCHSKKTKFKCVNSFIFKVKDIEKECAVLELLVFKSDLKHSNDHGEKCHSKDDHSACSQIDHKELDDLIGTGICITVDLSCFCSITCLPAIHLRH
ncbi:spore coat protein [Halobacillus halophilus]|uniref:Spore coat protein n=1 Tax=Halobacillus halophilus (strain ATCC 35676 / DSM 2266 / JCM 20832 / KCTC 3685 / LMG 17431 / NBRC 102448 / NCIMB 2269) TaxID=866895 RepID=I0JSF4_HALH3|nr:CotY/CotZ family spore coat protein [Halobacillus halophilus]ASF41015.1 spore coat protein [Halobacillus halophilus]CCG47076.1 spore coat protein [Halobacillus halophilus DSM 2266]